MSMPVDKVRLELIAVIVIAAVVFVVGAAFLFLYNRLVRLRNKADNAWHQIDVELNRRHDLMPELADVVPRGSTPRKGW